MATKYTTDSYPYKVYTANITYGVMYSYSGTLVIGKSYIIYTLSPGDDFTNVGYISDEVLFIATDVEPTDWSYGTEVLNITDSQPVVNTLQNSFPGIEVAFETGLSIYGNYGNYGNYGLTFRKTNAFPTSKFFSLKDNLHRVSDSLLIFSDGSPISMEFKVYN